MEQFWTKIKNLISKTGWCGALFALILFSFGIVNACKAMKFWINDEEYDNEWTIDLGSKGEIEYISNFWGKNNFLNLNGFMRNLTGQREMNGIVKLNNGYLFVPYDRVEDQELEERAKDLGALEKYLSSRGTSLLVALAPDTSSKYDPQIPLGTVSYCNDNLDRLIPMLQGEGIDVMDLREVIHEDGIDQYTMMYKTDHHWTTRAGFYVYGKIADWIGEKTGVEAEEQIRSLDHYNITLYKNWHLGSRGQRTGALFAGIDDFELILPDFDTLLEGREGTGTFEDLFINYEPFAQKDPISRYTYELALRQSCGNYKNLKADNDLKLLVIGDSFSEAVCPYLNISYGEIRYLYNQQSDTLDAGYLEEYDPDVVVCLYYPENVFGAGGTAFDLPR